MDVALLCPLVTGIVSWSAPERLMTVVVKGTFALTGPDPGGLAKEQHSLDVEWPWGAEPGTEIETASDFVPRKAKSDVFVIGHARAASPSTSIPIYVEVKGVPQRLRKRATAVSDTALSEIPLTSAFLRTEDGSPTRSGPVPGLANWRTLVDSHFDFSGFNTAPKDQQIPTVASGCRLVLHGLVPNADPCELRISPIEPGVYLVPTRTKDEVGRLVSMRCDTLVIDVDRAVCTLTWRGEIPAPSSEEAYLVVGAQLDTAPSWLDVSSQMARANWIVASEENVALRSLGIEPPAAAKKRPRQRSKMHTMDLASELRAATDAALPFRQRVPTGADAAFAELDDEITFDGAEAPAAGGTIPPPPSPESAVPIAGDTIPPPPDDASIPPQIDPPSSESLAGDTIPPPSEPASDDMPTIPPPPRSAGSARPPRQLELESIDDTDEIPPAPQAGGTIPPPALGSGTLNLDEHGGLGMLLGGNPGVPFLKPAPGAASPPPLATEAEPRKRRERTETRELDNEQLQDALAQALGGKPLPFEGTPPVHSPAPPVPPQMPPAPVNQVAPPPPPSRPMGPAPAQAIPASPVSFPIPPAPLSTREATAPTRDAPPVPEREVMPLATYAAIKVALFDESADLTQVLNKNDVTERGWRLAERQMAIDLARDATDGDGRLATQLQQAMKNARRAKQNERGDMDRQEHDLERYCLIRAELDEAEDPVIALQELGVTKQDWTKLRRKWSGRCLADPQLAENVKERLAEARGGIRALD